VLRKQPPGRLLPSAHAVDREYQVLAALQATPVAVPTVVSLCTDADVLGAQFYVMKFVDGQLHLDPTLPDSTTEHRAAVYKAMVGVHLVNACTMLCHDHDHESVAQGLTWSAHVMELGQGRFHLLYISNIVMRSQAR
jgi:aminoglycoside phosphotransferase (APT) family kinase protein